MKYDLPIIKKSTMGLYGTGFIISQNVFIGCREELSAHIEGVIFHISTHPKVENDAQIEEEHVIFKLHRNTLLLLSLCTIKEDI